MKKQTSYYLFWTTALTMLGVTLAVLTAPAAQALTPNDIPDNLRIPVYTSYDIGPYTRPQDNVTYPNGCVNVPEKYMINDWVSKAGDVKNNQIVVPYGATTVDLAWTIGTFACRDQAVLNGSMYDKLPQDGTVTRPDILATYSKADPNSISVSLGTMTPGGLSDQMVIIATSGTRYWFSNQNPFQINLPSLEPGTYPVSVEFMAQGMNVFSAGGNGYCITNSTVRVPVNSSNYSRCEWTKTGVGFNIVVGCKPGTIGTPGNCVSPQCIPLALPATSPITMPITFTPTVGLTGELTGSAPLPNMIVTRNGPTGQTTLFNGPATLSIDGRTLVGPSLSTTPTVTGAYSFSISLSGTLTQDCGATTVYVGYQPYLTVENGDAAAGKAFCSGSPYGDTPPGMPIRSWNELPPSNLGASSGVSALATGQISNYISARQMGSNNGAGLSLSNENGVVDTGQRHFGGSLTDIGCTEGFSQPGGTSLSVDATTNAATLPTTYGTYVRTGDLTLNAAQLPSGTNVAIYVTGNVYIPSNITYSTYTSLADIPRFSLYVTGGNIIVGKDVTELHGSYAVKANVNADGSLEGGAFYTCGTSPGTPASVNAALYDQCKQPLTVYGSVSADRLVLLRTKGSWNLSGTEGAPAERFVYTPELWLSAKPKAGSSTAPTFDLYQTLPPIL